MSCFLSLRSQGQSCARKSLCITDFHSPAASMPCARRVFVHHGFYSISSCGSSRTCQPMCQNFDLVHILVSLEDPSHLDKRRPLPLSCLGPTVSPSSPDGGDAMSVALGIHRLHARMFFVHVKCGSHKIHHLMASLSLSLCGACSRGESWWLLVKWRTLAQLWIH